MKFLLFSVVLILGLGFIGAGDALAQLHYEPLVELPRLDPNTQSTEQYVNALYLLAITIAALLAVVKIIFGGVKWMLSDVVTDKSAAKKDIRGALLGLLIVLSAVIVLETINTDLTNLNILGGATGIEGSEDDDVEEELPPPPDAEIGDSMNLTEAEDGEAEHFIATCPGVINEAPGGSGDTYLHCEEEEDEVSELELQCSGSSCTCNYSAGGNRGFCMSKCQTADRAGYKFVKANDQPNQILECVFAEQNELSECSNFFVTCLSNMVGSSCEVDASRVCRVETSGNNTNFYYFE